MISPKEKVYRYGIYDFKKHALVGQFNEGGTAKARYLVAEHYKYLRCNRSSLCKMFDIIGSSRAKVFKWLLKHSVNNRLRTKNVIYSSQRKIARKIKVSKNTVRAVIDQLQENKMAIIETDVIILSPMLFFYGNDNEFLSKLKQFKKLLPNNKRNKRKSHKKTGYNLKYYEVNQVSQKNLNNNIKYMRMLQLKFTLTKKRIQKQVHQLKKQDNSKMQNYL